MILGIGCDVVDHLLTEELDWISDIEFQKGIFSVQEISLLNIQKNVRFISGRFAVKEAVLKCLGTGMQDGISLRDIEVLQKEEGQPFITLNGEVKNISNKLGINTWHVTITHSSNMSIAFVVAERV